MKNTGVRRTLVGASVCALTLVGFGAGTASAGEITGNGKPVGSGTEVSFKDPVTGQTFYGIVLKARSICAYSGLNDGFIDPVKYSHSPEDAQVRVQSWGTDKKLFDMPKGLPGTACNPNSEPPPPPA